MASSTPGEALAPGQARISGGRDRWRPGSLEVKQLLKSISR